MAAAATATTPIMAQGFDKIDPEDVGTTSGSDFDSDSDIPPPSDSEMSVGDSQDHPAMVWDEQDGKAKGLSTFSTTMSLVTSIIGAGIMALPMLPKIGGINAVMLFCLVGAWATQESCSAYFKAWMAWNKTHKEEKALVTFEDFAVVAVGKWGGILVRCCLLIGLLGTMSGYVVLITQQLKNLSGLPWAHTTWVAAVAPVLWFLCMMRDISAVAKLVPLAVVAAIGSCCLIALAAWDDQDNWESWPEKDQERLHSYGPEHGYLALGSVFATITGAFGVIANVPPILSEMRRPRKFPQAMKASIGIVTTLYLAIIVVGYWGYGNFIQPNILVSMTRFPMNATEAFDMPASQWTGHSQPYLANMLSYCVLCNLMLSYPVMMMSVFASIQGLSCAKETMQPGQPKNYLMRTGFVAVTLFIAGAVPNFGVIFELFASITGPTLGFFVPILFGAIIRNKVGAKGSSPVRWILHSFIILSGIFCLIIGFAGSVKDLLEELTSGGES